VEDDHGFENIQGAAKSIPVKIFGNIFLTTEKF